MTTKAKMWIVVVLGLIVIFALLAGTKVINIRKLIASGAAMVPPPEAISTAKAESADWRAARSAVGTLTAVHSVTLESELAGKVTEVLFDSGQTVHKGQELVRMDVSVEEAQLKAAEADRMLAQQTLKRTDLLRQHGSNTPADVEAADAKDASTNAAVAQLRATITKKVIRAPFDGRLGIRQVELGQILSASTPIATLQSVSPIYAEFYLPQQVLGELKVGMDAQLKSDAFPDATWSGKITIINPEIDVSTRNVRIRATFPNLDGQLKPGMYGNVDVLSPDVRQVLIIPATSVLYAPYGDSVFTVGEKPAAADGGTEQKPGGLVASQKFVRVGERRGDYIAVESGLQAGDTVASAGVFKLRNGESVVVKNDLAPDVQVHPNPLER